MSDFKQQIVTHFDSLAPRRKKWFEHNRLYHQQVIDVCRLFLNPTARVLEIGCGTGDLLAALNPACGVGIDISPRSIEQAQQTYPEYEWLVADIESLPDDERLRAPFDLIIMEDVAGYLTDVQTALERIQPLMHPGSRLVISTWNWLWEPVLQAGEQLGLKAPDLMLRENWLSASLLKTLLDLSGYETLLVQPGLLMPYDLPLITPMINGMSHSPFMRRLTLLSTIVAAPLPAREQQEYSVSVIIPTRNEAGNIAALVERTPNMGSHTELIFVDGDSTDGTIEAIHEQIKLHPERDIRFIPQIPPNDPNSDMPPNLMLKLGKGDAVRKGFAAAKGDILMILDSDVSVAPEEMTRFYDALASGKTRFANGTRFAYDFHEAAMKSLNRAGNVFFSLAFSWLLGQRITDTLCGTKVLFRKDYERIAAARNYFGEFDPFGDFDLLFGAARLGIPIKDVPVHYLARTYGESKVRVSLHGPLLGRMSLFALWQFKIRPLFAGSHPRPEAPAETTSSPVQSSTGRGWLVVAALALLAVGWIFRRKS